MTGSQSIFCLDNIYDYNCMRESLACMLSSCFMSENKSLEQLSSSPFDSLKETFWAIKELKNMIVGDKLTQLEYTITSLPEAKKEQIKNFTLDEQLSESFSSYLDKLLTIEEKNDFMNIFPGTDLVSCTQSFLEEKKYITEQAQQWNIKPYKKLQTAFLLYPKSQHLQTILSEFYKKYDNPGQVSLDKHLQTLTTYYKELWNNTIVSTLKQSQFSKKTIPVLSPEISSLMDNSKIEWKTSDKVKYDDIVDREWLSLEAFTTAYTAFTIAKWQGLLTKDRFLTVVDYSKSSKENRLFVVDLYNRKVVLKSTAGHGRWSWRGEYVDEFSNISWSKQTSVGLFKTSWRVERASHGRREWLRLFGLEKWLNDKAANRGIFMHKSSIKWSEWCITIPDPDKASFLNKVLVWGYPIYNYTDKKEVLAQSELLEQSLYPLAA